MNNQLTNAINLLHDSKLSNNLTNEQIKAITTLENAYLDLDNKYTNKISRRNMLAKDLRKTIEELNEEIKDLQYRHEHNIL